MRYDAPPYYLTAYGLACKRGFVGSLDEWLESITAYGEAVKHGFRGSKEEWLVSISAYGEAVKQGFQGSAEEWIASLKGERGDASYSHVNINPAAIELSPPKSAAHGGYIDFHYQGSEVDYTTRLIEDASGVLSMNGRKLLTSGNLIAVYNTTVDFEAGVGYYYNSVIVANVTPAFAQFRAGAITTLVNSPIGITSEDGRLKIVLTYEKTESDLPMNIFLFVP